MRLRLIWAGRTKEDFIAQGINKYLRLLRSYAKVEIVEVREQRSGDMLKKRLQTEGKAILRATKEFMLLDERGVQLSSEGLAGKLDGKARMDFVLGGAYGVSEEVREMAAETIALSSMTLTHEMARLLLVEQLYRAFTILKGGRYHH